MSAVLNEYDYLISRAKKRGNDDLALELEQARDRYLAEATKPE